MSCLMILEVIVSRVYKIILLAVAHSEWVASAIAFLLLSSHRPFATDAVSEDSAMIPDDDISEKDHFLPWPDFVLSIR